MTPVLRVLVTTVFLTTASWFSALPCRAQESADPNVTQAEDNDIQIPIEAEAAFAETWQQGALTVTALRGGDGPSGLAELRQGELYLHGQSLVIFDMVSDGLHDVRVYAEGRVLFENHGQRRNMASHLMRVEALQPVRVEAPITSRAEQMTDLMRRAMERIDPTTGRSATPVSLPVSQDLFVPPRNSPLSAEPTPLSRRIQVRPRSGQPLQFDSYISRDTVPEEQVYIFTGGVNVLVEGMQMDVAGQLIKPGVLDLSADRVVIWTQPNDSDGLDPLGMGTIVQSGMTRFQVYLEGNILVRQDRNTVTASHAFFDANSDRALLINAELRAYLPQTGGTFRVRAERLRQISQNRFHAKNGWSTTSSYGKPGYRLQASDIFVEPGPISPFTELDPLTGQPVNGPPLWVTALNSQLLVGDQPIAWLPRISAPAEDPNIPISRAVVKQDRIFGLQIKTVWNLTKILGQPNQKGMQWDLLADYLSKRGPALGVAGDYDVRNQAGRAQGISSIIWQLDDGVDNLGRDRRALVPADQNRGQIIWRHKQELPDQTLLFGEIGYVTDRNYRESFHEPAFDTEKDVETLLGVRRDAGAWSGMFWGRTELNEFDTSTDWLPRADILGFSQPLAGGLAYWSSHSSLGYGDLEAGAPPTNPADPWVPGALSGVTDASGMVAMTRHQIDAPFMVGPVSVNPFVMGEAAFWDEGFSGDDVDRYVISGGVQAQVTATRILPFFRNELWNLNGLAHKSENFIEYRVTDASRNLNEIAQYNEIDEDSNERGRIRYASYDFGGTVPAEFDTRFYAVRHGTGLWVSAPYHELVEDQQVVRLRTRNRLQTKAGPPGSQRIRDWMIWESGLTFFPDADRDNFGEDIGLIYSNYRWNINDRTSILADGILDLFDNAQDIWSVGLLTQRSTRGSLYFGFRQVKATNYIDSQTLVASYSYHMSPKWISTGSVAYDVAAGESRGASLTFSRVGLDWVMHFGFGVDTSKDNVGVAVALEPRFGPPSPTNLSYLLGLQR